MEDVQAVTAPRLTQGDGLALKVEVLQHQDKGAALRCWLHPSAHLAALDVIPGGEGSGGHDGIQLYTDLRYTGTLTR